MRALGISPKYHKKKKKSREKEKEEKKKQTGKKFDGKEALHENYL